jgi:hypothetical protein
MEKNRTLFADFPTLVEAERAITALEGIGFAPQELSVLTRAQPGNFARADARTPAIAGKGALIGLAIGAVAGVICAYLANGPLTAVADAFFGGHVAHALGVMGLTALLVSGVSSLALMGLVLGALAALGLSRSGADYFQDVVERGGIVLGVPVHAEDEVSVHEFVAALQAGQQPSVAPEPLDRGQSLQTIAAAHPRPRRSVDTLQRGNVRLDK